MICFLIGFSTSILLYELMAAVRVYGEDNNRDDIVEAHENLVDGKRLKDISDLPLDLSV